MKIICVGNRFLYPDGAALWLYDDAIKYVWPQEVEWIEGGLGGLNLITHFDTNKDVLVLDFIPNKNNGEVFDSQDEHIAQPCSYSHANALYYLLNSLTHVYDSVPNVLVMACNPEHHNWKQLVLQSINKQVSCYE